MPVPQKSKGDPLLASEVNRLSAAEKLVSSIRGGNGIRVKRTASGVTISYRPTGARFLCKIVTAGPDSEADYTDSRYWVSVVFVANTSGSDTEKIELTVWPNDNVRHQILTATNLAEYLDDTHQLREGTPVWVTEVYDKSSGPVRKYVIESGGGTVPVGEYVGMSLQVTGQNAIGYQFEKLHPLLPGQT